MTAPVPGAEQMVAAYAAARAQLTANAIGNVTAQFQALDPYASAAVDRFAETAAQLAQAAQMRTAQLTEAYLRGVLALMKAASDDRAAVRPTGRRGVRPAQVYARPAETVRYERSTGIDLEAATDRGVRRLQTLVDTDVALAARDAAHGVLANNERITGWRRVLRPEMSRSGPCGLCMVASDRIYKRGDLLDLHDGCYCIPLPITRAFDPGQELNGDDLDRVYSAAGGRTDRAALQRVRIATREHGELGPRLVDAAHRFRGPDDVAA